MLVLDQIFIIYIGFSGNPPDISASVIPSGFSSDPYIMFDFKS